jgi:hypothetical protein
MGGWEKGRNGGAAAGDEKKRHDFVVANRYKGELAGHLTFAKIRKVSLFLEASIGEVSDAFC